MTITVTAYGSWWEIDYVDDGESAPCFSTANEIHIEIQFRVLINKVDIYASGAMLCYFYLIVAIAIGAIIVMLMKGPAFVVDPYPLVGADRPSKRNSSKDTSGATLN